MLIDLHCHTTRSQDSRLTPSAAIDAARAAGLDAVCFTEHDVLWSFPELDELSRGAGFPVLAGVEVSTEIGHVLAYGLPEFDLGLRRFDALVERAGDCGAALVLAHPFRRHFRAEPPSVLSERVIGPAFRRRGLSEVAALESDNGATRSIENSLAAEIARRVGLPTIAGSDAHAPGSVGARATEVGDPVAGVTELAAAIVAGRVRVPDGATRGGG